MAEIIKSYIGVGKVHARAFGTTGKFREVGNVSVLTLQHEVDTQKQADYQRSGGGTLVRVDRLTAIIAAMTWLTFSAANWALAMAGTAAEVVAGTATDEVVAGYKGATVKLLHPPAAITSVTNVGGTITYEAGTHYQKTGAGLFFPDDSTIVDAANLEVTYTYNAYTRLEGAMGVSSELELFFDGLNEADSDKPFLVDLWRVSVPSADEIALIGTQLGQMVFQAELLKDPGKGSGVSAYYRARAT